MKSCSDRRQNALSVRVSEIGIDVTVLMAQTKPLLRLVVVV
jgi:hypothetical protein